MSEAKKGIEGFVGKALDKSVAKPLSLDSLMPVGPLKGTLLRDMVGGLCRETYVELLKLRSMEFALDVALTAAINKRLGKGVKPYVPQSTYPVDQLGWIGDEDEK